MGKRFAERQYDNNVKKGVNPAKFVKKEVKKAKKVVKSKKAVVPQKKSLIE